MDIVFSAIDRACTALPARYIPLPDSGGFVDSEMTGLVIGEMYKFYYLDNSELSCVIGEFRGLARYLEWDNILGYSPYMGGL